MRSNFTATITKLLACANADAFAHEEIDAFYAPSECHALVNRSTEREMQAILADAGYTAKELESEAVERTSYRWVHFNLGYVFHCIDND